MSQLSNKFDLEERTAKFGEEVILLCRSIAQDSVTKPIINQLVRSATSIGNCKLIIENWDVTLYPS